jgi:hypothetical protein
MPKDIVMSASANGSQRVSFDPSLSMPYFSGLHEPKLRTNSSTYFVSIETSVSEEYSRDHWFMKPKAEFAGYFTGSPG